MIKAGVGIGRWEETERMRETDTGTDVDRPTERQARGTEGLRLGERK